MAAAKTFRELSIRLAEREVARMGFKAGSTSDY
jgi:hypothetical protein